MSSIDILNEMRERELQMLGITADPEIELPPEREMFALVNYARQNPIVCYTCNVSFKTRAEYRQHTQTH